MKSLLALTAALFLSAPLMAKAPDKKDYAESVNLRKKWQNLTRDLIFPIAWLQDSHEFAYRKSVDGGFRYLIEDAKTGETRPAFNQQAVAAALSEATNEKVGALSLPFEQFSLSNQGKTLHFALHYIPWQCKLEPVTCQPVEPSAQRPKAFGVVRDLTVSRADATITAPDGQLFAQEEKFNLVIRDQNGTEVFRTSDGTRKSFYDIDSIVWAADSMALIVVKVVPGEANYVTRVVAAPEGQVQPQIVKQLYPKPGDRVDVDQPVIIDLAKKHALEVNNTLFPSPYQLTGFYWRKDSKTAAFHYIERGHQLERIIEIKRKDGAARALITETAETFIYSDRDFYHDVGRRGKEIIWLSERDGWAHLYLYDGENGKLKQQITQGDWLVRNVVHIDDDNRQIYFAASGMNANEDPYFIHYYRINFDGSNLIPLTTEKANHRVTFSDDMAYYVDNYSRVDLPNIVKLYATNAPAKPIRTVAKADITNLQQAGFEIPQKFVAKGRDGTSDIWGLIVKPLDFDPKKRYPVIENIYAGPHDSFVPKSFWPFGYHSGGDKVIGMQALANLGFIVVMMDGMGTANRSKAFHDVAWKNLGDSGFPDRILWHQAAASQFPWYNIENGVGLYGGSAGGQSTLGGLIFHPEFYTTGVAFAGCFDNRMDKISWNEQWMGYPVGEEYAASSGVENAHKLQGDIFIITGEQDSNVDPASTMQVVDALVKAGKDFDLLIIPNGGHSAGRSSGPVDYAQRRQFDFFVEKLGKKSTPHWNQTSE